MYPLPTSFLGWSLGSVGLLPALCGVLGLFVSLALLGPFTGLLAFFRLALGASLRARPLALALGPASPSLDGLRGAVLPLNASLAGGLPSGGGFLPYKKTVCPDPARDEAIHHMPTTGSSRIPWGAEDLDQPLMDFLGTRLNQLVKSSSPLRGGLSGPALAGVVFTTKFFATSIRYPSLPFSLFNAIMLTCNPHQYLLRGIFHHPRKGDQNRVSTESPGASFLLSIFGMSGIVATLMVSFRLKPEGTAPRFHPWRYLLDLFRRFAGILLRSSTASASLPALPTPLYLSKAPDGDSGAKSPRSASVSSSLAKLRPSTISERISATASAPEASTVSPLKASLPKKSLLPQGTLQRVPSSPYPIRSPRRPTRAPWLNR